MWRAAILPGLMLLAACHEPTFDERYASAEKATRDKAAEIDKELAEREKAAGLATAIATGEPNAMATR